MPSAEPTQSPRQMLNEGEISARMTRDGFAELEQCWQDFLTQQRDLASLDEAQLEKESGAHREPLFGNPAVVGLAAAGGAAGTHYVLGSAVDEMTDSLPTSIRPIAEAAYYVNAAVLVVAAAVSIQRYVLTPFRSIMARQAASMLRWPSFRDHVTASSRFTAAKEKFVRSGINSDWDDPDYRRCYQQIDGKVTEVSVESEASLITATLRTMLGHKDELTRKHVPGRLGAHLKDGKRSISAIVAKYGAELLMARQAALPAKRACEIFEDIQNNFCTPGTDAVRYLARQISRLQDPRAQTPEKGICAKIWDRDPWVDLTSQKEFFSSASLRSKSIFESGSKGRLGTFGYLHNPSICCLDFSTHKGRVVRARMLAAFTSTETGPLPLLFVDGVEGTNSVSPALIRTAIEDYARACGFHSVVYNANVHNSTPKNFVRHLAEQRIPLRELGIEGFDCTTREYLDAFGLPLQPFEYMYPRGKVLGHIVSLRDGSELQGKEESSMGRLQRFLQKRLLYIFFADAAAFGILASAQVSGTLAVGVGAVTLAGLALNEWYQGRSARAR